MEGAALHLVRGRANQPLTAPEHFVGGAAGEGEEQNASGGDAASYKVGNPVNEGSGFAGAGAGHDQEGGVAVGGRCGLGGIQGGPLGRQRGRGDDPGGRDVDPWGLSHGVV